MDEVSSKFKGQILTDEQAMSLAIQEGKKGLGFVSPNPPVGCVILDDENRCLGVGYHKVYGGPHAEVNALSSVNYQRVQRARVFVTLEPCAHEGKTGSCAKLLSQLPINEVIFGLVDPNPLVSGKGEQMIKAAGIKTTIFGKMIKELEELPEHFLVNQFEQRVFVSVKVASSIDGQMALKGGESQWITGEAARLRGQFLRGTHDAVVVGKNTVLLDDPRLDLRHPTFAGKKLGTVVVFDTKGEIFNKDHQLFQVHRPEQLWVVVNQDLTSEIERRAQGRAKLIPVPSSQEGLDINDFLSKAWDLGLKSIFLEGGGQLISSFIAKGLVDRLYLFQAPLVVGAISGHSWTQGVRINALSDGLQLSNPRIEQLGKDWLITGRMK